MSGKKKIEFVNREGKAFMPDGDFFNSLPFGVCFYVVDDDKECCRENFRFLDGNEEFFRCIGYQREELNGRQNDFNYFLRGKEYEKFLSTIEMAVKEPEQIHEIDTGVHQKDGTISYVRGQMRLLQNSNYQYCICCIIINVDRYVNENLNLFERFEASRRETNNLNRMIGKFPAGIAVIEGGMHCRIEMVNHEFFSSIGYQVEEIMSGNRDLLYYCHKDDRIVLEEMIEECLRRKAVVEREMRFLDKEGKIRWMTMRICTYTHKNAIPYFLMASWDITDRKQMEDEVRLQTERNRLLEELTNEIALDYDVNNECFRINDYTRDKYCFHRNDLPREEYIQLVHKEDWNRFNQSLKRALSQAMDGVIECRLFLREKGQQPYYRWYRVAYRSIMGNAGDIIRIIGRMYNIDKEKRIRNQLQEKARRDPMTGLLNKQALQEEVEEFLHEKKPGIHAFMVIDIDNFKKINDTFGHVFGDTIIKEVSEKISEQFRRLDIIGRVGGDEFVVCMKYATIEHAKEKARSLCESVKKKYGGNKEERTVTCSVGIVFFGEEEPVDYETLFSRADMAMYQAKMSGKNSYQIADKHSTLREVLAQKAEQEEQELRDQKFDKEFLERAFELLTKAKDIDSSINLLLERIGRRFDLNMVVILENKNMQEEDRVMTNCWMSDPKYLKIDVCTQKLHLWQEHPKTDRLLIANCSQKGISKEDKQIFREIHAKAYAQFLFGKQEKPEGSIIFCDCEQAREWSAFEEQTLSEVVRMMAVFVAIRRQREQADYEIQYLQEQDPLTGLYNLSTFKRKVAQVLRMAGRNEIYAMVCLDISGFSYINENFGHSEGDLLLEEMANYIMNEPYVLLACRRYADLFLILTRTESKEQCVQKLLEANQVLNEYIKQKYPSGNIYENTGVYFWENDSYDIEELIENANLARKETKKEQEFCLRVYSNSIKEEKDKERLIASGFYTALNNEEFEIYLQPKFLLNERTIYGAEALARWKRLDGRYHNPNEFIPVLEKFGYINDLDFYVFEQTVKCLDKWNRDGKERMVLSSNFSGKHFGDMQGDFVKKVCEIADKYNVEHSQLEIEITESVAVRELERLQETLIELREKGFRIAIDDFGTGYSSLNVLFDVAADVVKIDKSFLNMDMFEKRKQLIMHIGEMVNLAGEEIIFEGVEEEEQIEFLKECGYKFGQGFIFDEPLNVLDFEQKYLY